MKQIFFISLIIFFTQPLDASFADLLMYKEPQPDPAYYQILANITDENPEFTFLRSRNLQTFSLESEYLEMVESATCIPAFLETGTYKGDTAEIAAHHFSNVHTIELSKPLAEKAQKRFFNKKNVTVHHGDSSELLPTILKKIKEKTVIFLDAHFSMHDTAKGKENTPIITELNHIKKSEHKDSVIIIDDIRMFYDPLIEPGDTFMAGYPTLNAVVEKILEINSEYKIAIIYDTLIAFTDPEITVSTLIRATTMSRLYNGSNYLIEDIILAELCIAQAKAKEQEAILELGSKWVEPFSQEVGFSRHYALWAGLILLNNEQYSEAEKFLCEAKKRGLNDWRIDWYIAMAQAQCFFDVR